MGLWSEIFREPSDERVDADIREGSAAARNSAEEQALSDHFDEYVEKGSDPLDYDPPNDGGSAPAGGM